MGSFVILLTVLAFTAGWLRNELALTLLGTIFLFVLACCFIGVFVSGIACRSKGKSLSMDIVSETAVTGETGELFIRTRNGKNN